MVTRKQYLSNPEGLHQAYYLEIAREARVKPSAERVERVRQAGGVDRIPLREWETWAAAVIAYNGPALARIFRERGDSLTMAGVVCMLKAAVQAELQQ
jgi:hypothetical protein